MKAKIIPIITVFTFFSIFFFSCEDGTLREYKGYAPVYMSYKDMRAGVAAEQNTDLKNPGKIYFKDNYIFIVEELKGIHVFDNSNPSAPINKSFVKLPGVVDISMSGSIMYADSYIDLVVLDLQDINNIREVGRVQDILPYTVPPAKSKDFPMGYVDKDKGVVIDWELRTIKEKVEPTPEPGPYPVYFKNGGGFALDITASGSSSGVSGSGVGVGGSMARFGIRDNILYLVNSNTLKIFDISVKTAPAKINDFNVGWNIETMFLSGNSMFLGTTNGMVIYDIKEPSTPLSLAFFTHATSCDPVIVDDSLAYITLRNETTCARGINVLDVVNIKNINHPTTLVSYPMVNPHGLGKAGDHLFICDGSAGLKVFDASDPLSITSHLIFTYPAIDAFDVIPIANVLVLIGDNGLYQYNYSDVKNITLLSSILVVK
jgi:hypothetical protein